MASAFLLLMISAAFTMEPESSKECAVLESPFINGYREPDIKFFRGTRV